MHRPLSKIAEKACTNATTDTLEVGPVPTGKTWQIDHISFVDVTSAITGVHFKQRGSGHDAYLKYVTNPGAGVPAVAGINPILLSEGQSIIAVVSGATLVDDIRLFVTGREINE